MTDSSAFVGQCAPIVNLFPYAAAGSPVYDPCSVGWYLENVELVNGGTVVDPASEVESQLPTYPSSAYLQIPDPNATSPLRAGNLQSAVAYVHIRPIGECFDLQYWLFSAVRGRSTFRLQFFDGSDTLELDYDLIAPPAPQLYQGAGEHQGDWKYVTVRIDASGEIQAVFYNQHSSGFWCLPTAGEPNQCQFVLDNGHPVVYSSRNTHSCFPIPGKTDQLNTLHEFKFAGYGFAISLLEYPSGGGEVWDCSQPNAPVVVSDESVSPAPDGPSWLQFPGYWGPPLYEDISPQAFAPIVQLIIGEIPILKDFEGTVEGWIAEAAQKDVESPQTGAQTPTSQPAWIGSVGWQANWLPVGPNSFHGNPGMPVTVMRQDSLATTQLFLSDNDGGVYTIAGTQEQGWPEVWTKIGGSFTGNTPYMPVTALWRDAAQTTIDIFVADNDGGVYTAGGDAGDWSASTFSRIGAPFDTEPGALVTAIWHDAAHTSMDVFTADNRGHVYVANGVPGGVWGSFDNPWGESGFSGNPGMPVTAIWRDPEQTLLDLFVADNKGHVYTVCGDPHASGWDWGGWAPLDYDTFATIPGTLVTAVWRPSGSAIDLFTSDNKGHVYTINGTLGSSGWQWPDSFTRVDPTFTGDSSGMPVTAQWCTLTSLSLFVTDASGIAQYLVFNPADWTPGTERFSPIVTTFIGSSGAPVEATWHDRGHTLVDLSVADNHGRVFTIAGCPFTEPSGSAGPRTA